MDNNLFLSAAVILAALLPSCTQNPEEVISDASITISVDEFVYDGVETKTNVDPVHNYAITWADGDAIGIFPRDGYQEPFTIPAEQVGNATVRFDGGYWQIKNGLTYNAYYPFSEDNFKGRDALTHIPVSYLGQSQNGKECNAGAYDYTYSDWGTASDGRVSFVFHHLGSFVVINLSLPEAGTYTNLRFKSSSNNIPTEGNYDLTAVKPVFVAAPGSMSDHIDMELTALQGEKDEVVTFYMMMPPVDLSGSELEVILTSTEGDVTYSIESKNIVASKLYEFTGQNNDISTMEYVDLGLSVKWATCNLGASMPEEYGMYYQWGDNQGYDSDTSDGKYFGWSIKGFSDYIWGSNEYNLDKYMTDASYGTVDDKTVLDPEDDAAHVALGGDWRMPTDVEWTELQNNCTWTWTTENGINGYRVTSNKSGYTSMSIFLPAAGSRCDDSLPGVSTNGYYWSSSLDIDYPRNALDISFDSGHVRRFSDDRTSGLTIRPVID